MGRGSAISARRLPAHRISTVALMDSTQVLAGLVRCEAAFMPPTIAAIGRCEFSRKGRCSRDMNTARMTVKVMDHMDDLMDSIDSFVRSAPVNTIEELQLLRMSRDAHRVRDGLQLLDYAYAIQMCAMKENGIWGQRYHQLTREAEAFRIGMAEREAERMETAQSVSADQAA